MDISGIAKQLLASKQKALPSSEASPAQALLTAPEAERLIDQLQEFKLADVGSAKWFQQQQHVSRMNMTAHHNAATHSDEFIVEQLVSLDKMKNIVHDLIALETWKAVVLPHLRHHLIHKVDSSTVYVLLYQEAALANLLECTLYHQHACEALPEEYLLELADWCARKLAYLASPQAREQCEVKDRSAKEMLDMSKEDEWREREGEIDFGVAMCALTITRYLTDHLSHVSMGLMGRLLTTNDIPMALAALLDSPPWVRRRAKGVQERWEGNAWHRVEPQDRLKLGKADGQVWLALNNLIVDPKCRAKYSPDEWRRDRLLSLKRYMHELLFDQLPVLKDLQRTLDEMALGVGTDANASRHAALLLEAVPLIRQTLMEEVKSPQAFALTQARTHFSEAEARKRAQATLMDMMAQLDLLTDEGSGALNGALGGAAVFGGGNSGGTQAGGGTEGQQGEGDVFVPGLIKVECSRKAHDSGVYEPWCEYEFSTDPAKPTEPVTLDTLHGVRYRLQPSDPATNRPMPTVGKIVVKLYNHTHPTHQPRLAEALLQLPDIPTKSVAGEKPPIVWVNVGILADEGLVLQLKLKRAEGNTGHERDKIAGGWYSYHPMGGALTVRRDASAPAIAPATGHGMAGGEALVPAVGLVGISQSGGQSGKNLISTVDTTSRQGQDQGLGGNKRGNKIGGKGAGGEGSEKTKPVKAAGKLQAASADAAAALVQEARKTPVSVSVSTPAVPVPVVTASDLEMPD